MTYSSCFFGAGMIPWIGWLMMIFWLAFWAALIYLVIKLFKRNTSQKGEALQIARKRLAKGEIDKKEFEEIKEELE